MMYKGKLSKEQAVQLKSEATKELNLGTPIELNIGLETYKGNYTNTKERCLLAVEECFKTVFGEDNVKLGLSYIIKASNKIPEDTAYIKLYVKGNLNAQDFPLEKALELTCERLDQAAIPALPAGGTGVIGNNPKYREEMPIEWQWFNGEYFQR